MGRSVRAGRKSATLLREHPDAAAVFSTLMETSTGVGHDIEGIGRAVKENGRAMFVVDGISGVGAMECRTDAWGIDMLVVGSQKALMTPPGLAFLAVSQAAWKQIEANRGRPAFYFDLSAYRKALATGDTPYTPAIPLVYRVGGKSEVAPHRRRNGGDLGADTGNWESPPGQALKPWA